MGSWFSNINVRKCENVTTDTVEDYISKILSSEQYCRAASAEEADGAVAIISGEDSGWFTVCSDLLTFDDPDSIKKLAVPMSEELKTDVMGIACFDSDYLFLNLINAGEKVDAWVGIGSATGLGIKRRSGLAAWKNKTSDFTLFSEAAKAKYILAEDFLETAGHCLGLPAAQSTASLAYLKDIDPERIATHIYFKLREDATPDNPVNLATYCLRYAQPSFIGQSNSMMAINTGLGSKGLSVYFLGPYVENDEITFSDVYLEYQRTETPLELKKIQLPDGQWAYYHHASEFRIPPKVSNSVPKDKRSLMEMEQRITVSFVPHGNPRKTLDITVVLVPDGNPQGKAVWNVWKLSGSKKAFIEHHNKVWKSIRAIEPDPDSCLPLLNEEDFD